MDPMAPEWTSSELEEFKSLVAVVRNEESCYRMEVLAKRFPAKTMHQLREKFVEVFADMLYAETDGEPGSDYATSDLHDWYKVLKGDIYGPVLGPSVETPLCQPSKKLVRVRQAVDEEGRPPQKRHLWSTDEHRQFLDGVKYLGRGEWKSISKYFVPTRTPAQLASHAQKYFNRIKKNRQTDQRQRYSINDIVLANACAAQLVNPNVSSCIPPSILMESTKIVDWLNPTTSSAFWQRSNGATMFPSQMAPINQRNLHPTMPPF